MAPAPLLQSGPRPGDSAQQLIRIAQWNQCSSLGQIEAHTRPEILLGALRQIPIRLKRIAVNVLELTYYITRRVLTQAAQGQVNVVGHNHKRKQILLTGYAAHVQAVH